MLRVRLSLSLDLWGLRSDFRGFHCDSIFFSFLFSKSYHNSL